MEKITIKRLGTFVIRPYQTEDEERVRALWKTAFQKEMPLSLWRWKYSDNPFGYRILLCVNETGDPVVMYGGIPYIANYKGENVEITNLMDVMSHPDYRKTGLFIQTGNAFFETFCGPDKSVILYGFPGSYHFDIGKKYLEYRKIPENVMYLSVETVRLAQSLAKPPAGCLNSVSDVDDAYDRLWKCCRHDYPLAIVRNAAFLRWRYIHHPFKSYQIWEYHDNCRRDLRAYAVLLISHGKATLSDLLAPASGLSLSDFWGVLGSSLSNIGIDFLETWLPCGHFLTHTALSCGFLQHSEPTGIIPTIRIFDPSMRFEWVCDHLYYTMADGDLI